MRSIKKIFYFLLRFSGIPFLIREIVQHRRVTILMFHDPDYKSAERTFNFLKKRYNVISLIDYINACNNNNASKIPSKAIIITFDDGHIGNYKLLPLIKKLNIPITIFLTAGIVGSNRHFWFKMKNESLSKKYLKSVPNKKRLSELEKVGFSQEKEYNQTQALTLEQINEMKKYVDFQAHTIFHPCLPQCDDLECEIEIKDSKRILEEKFGLGIKSLAFPNGDYTDREIDFTQKSGYKAALTVDFGYNDIDSNIFSLKRLSTDDVKDINEMVVRISGLKAFMKN